MELEKELLWFLAKYKVASSEDVKEKFFKENHISTMYRKMKKLAKKKKILKQVHPTRAKNDLIYSLGKNGALEVLENMEYKDVKQFQEGSEVLSHDLRFVEIGSWFEKSTKCLDFITENIIPIERFRLHPALANTFQDLRSDAVVCWGEPQDYSWICLEYEASLKNYEKLRDKIKKFYAHSIIDYVFYFCNGPQIMNAVKKVDSEICTNQESKVYFFNSENDFFDCNRIQLKNSHGNEITVSLS